MRSAYIFRFGLPLIISVLVTGGAYFIDTQISLDRQITLGLNLSRQLASQVEMLSLNARQKNEPNPLSWAIQLLSISAEPRLIQLTPLEDAHTLGNSLEHFQYTAKRGNLMYAKVLDSQTGSGVRIQIHLGYVGFLGATSPWINDFWLLGLFSLIIILVYALITRTRFESIEIQTDLNPRYKKAIETAVAIWTEEARTGLMRLGLNMKSVVQESQNLAASAAKSREILLVQAEYNADVVKPALDSYEKVFQVTQTLNTSIDRTKQSLLEEAKLLQELKSRISLNEYQ